VGHHVGAGVRYILVSTAVTALSPGFCWREADLNRGVAVKADLFLTQVAARVMALVDAMPHSVRLPVAGLAARPGKGVRAAMLAACAGCGVVPDPWRLVRLGAVVELLHLASLLHDDLVDQATTRRGAPAAHTVAGADLTMLAGTAAFALSGAEVAALGGDLHVLVARAVTELAYGEMLDVERAYDVQLSMVDYLELAERKTGELFRLACLLGAVEAGAEPAVARSLAEFGARLGVAFQILDDCLDLRTGTGKPTGTDHLLGLFGAPALFALRDDPGGELATLLLSPSLRPSDLPAVRRLIEARGGFTAAGELARTCHDEALATLDELDPGTRDRLTDTVTSVWRVLARP
jgi:heptaprenyl diphosphate synthase